ncbi:MAG: carboxypeptidase regulatory-like domain-containing protein [Planctomycetes bacterium]|nr:carboxypeptidase regulatory-like domain-containing protein [Planctomycetota bacterium]
MIVRHVLRTALALALQASLLGQGQHPLETQEVLGRVRTESGRGVAAARVVFLPDPPHGLSWLGSIDGPGEAVATTTQRDGRFRLAVAVPSGAVLVETDDGLGALVERVAAGAPIAVEARPVGEIARDDGKALDADVRWLARSGNAVPLGRRAGAAIRLPAGRHALLVRDGERLVEARIDVASGSRHRLALPARSGQAIAADQGVTWRLARWPEAGDLDGGSRSVVLLAPDRVLRLRREAEGTCIASSWTATDAVPPAFPDGSWHPVRVVAARGGGPVPGARVLTVVANAGEVLVLAEARSGADGAAAVMASTAPDPWRRIVVIAPSGAVVGLGLDLVVARGEPIAIDADAIRRIRLVDEDGAAVAGARVVLADGAMPFLTRSFGADARGIVTLLALPRREVELRVDSGRHVPRGITLVPRDEDGDLAEFVLARGAPVDVLVVRARGGAASDVDVELRDPSGALGLEPRVAVTDAAGRCRFEGLPFAAYTLFASQAPGGVTWSGRRTGVQPGAEEWTIELRSEDPPPPDRSR